MASALSLTRLLGVGMIVAALTSGPAPAAAQASPIYSDEMEREWFRFISHQIAHDLDSHRVVGRATDAATWNLNSRTIHRPGFALMSAVDRTEVEPVHQILLLKDPTGQRPPDPKIAINNPALSPPKIWLHIEPWRELSPSEQAALAIHEYLPITGELDTYSEKTGQLLEQLRSVRDYGAAGLGRLKIRREDPNSPLPLETRVDGIAGGGLGRLTRPWRSRDGRWSINPRGDAAFASYRISGDDARELHSLLPRAPGASNGKKVQSRSAEISIYCLKLRTGEARCDLLLTD